MSHVSKMTFSLYIAALMSVSLACGATLPTEQEVFAQKPTVTETAQSVNTSSEPVQNRYIVTAETLQIRTGAGETFPALKVYLSQNEIVTCSDIEPAADGGLWCKHDLGWSNIRYMKGK